MTHILNITWNSIQGNNLSCLLMEIEIYYDRIQRVCQNDNKTYTLTKVLIIKMPFIAPWKFKNPDWEH